MTLEEVVSLAKELGHGFRLKPDGSPTLTGEQQPETPALLRVLRFHRDELVRWIGHAPVIPDFGREIECRWGMGRVGRHWFPDQGWPAGAMQWRHVGEAEWHDIPAHELPKSAPPARERLQAFWAAEGWVPVGGWKPGERT